MRVSIEKDELLKILEDNRSKHKGIFEEALVGYQAHVLKILEDHIARIKKGKKERVYINLPEPSEHTSDYDRAIRMVKLHTGETIDLSEEDSAKYLMDDWGWRKEFLTSNSTYSVSAANLLNE